MTAITVIRQFNAVHVLSDTGVFDEHGRLVAFTNKVWPMPHKNAVICIRGLAPIAAAIAEIVFRVGCASYDDMRSNVRRELRSNFEAQAALFRSKGLVWGELKFDVIIAGYSESVGPHCYAFFSYDMASVCLAWDEVLLGPIAPLPSTDEMMARLNLPDVDTLSIERDGLRIANEQRKVAMPFDVGAPGCGLGGALQLTTITTHMITQRIIHRWPDKIGERITP